MKDAVSISRVKLLHPKVRDEVAEIIGKIEIAFPENLAIRVVQGLRTIEEQNEIYAQGRTKPGKVVTKAKGGSSFHNYGLAFDFALLYDKDHNGTFETLVWGEKDPHWKDVVNYFEDNGWFWGGNFSTIHDAPHLEKTFGWGWRGLLKKYNDGDFIQGTEYVNI